MSAPIVDGVRGIVDRVGDWGHTAGSDDDRKDHTATWDGTKWTPVYNSTYALVDVTTEVLDDRLDRMLKTRKTSVKGADSLAAVVVSTVTGSNVEFDATDTDSDATARSTNNGSFVHDNDPGADRTSGYGHTNGTPHD